MNIARKLLLLNGLAILGVIAFHSVGWGLVSLFAWGHRYLPAGSDPYAQAGSLSYYVLRAIEQLSSYSVPAFIFVSGFFVAITADHFTYRLKWTTVGRRVVGLLIPYLVWTMILMGARFLEGKPWSLVELARGLATGAVNPAYYFVPLLIQLYLLAPFLVRPAATRPGLLVLATVVLQLGIYLAQYPVLLEAGAAAPLVAFASLFPKWFFPVRLFWFVLGIVTGFHLGRLQPIFTRGRYWLLAGIGGFALVGFLEWELLVAVAGSPGISNRETLVDGLFTACVIFSFLAWSRLRLPFAGTIVFLGLSSFGIYLVHSPVMEVTARALYHLWPALLAQPLLIVLVTAAAGLAVPVLLMQGVRRSPMRWLYPYLFG